MDKRLAKRHKRQVSRARKIVKLSEPDVRTPEQIEAARLASRTDFRSDNNPWPHYRAVLVPPNNPIVRGEPRTTVAPFPSPER